MCVEQWFKSWNSASKKEVWGLIDTSWSNVLPGSEPLTSASPAAAALPSLSIMCLALDLAARATVLKVQSGEDRGMRCSLSYVPAPPLRQHTRLKRCSLLVRALLANITFSHCKFIFFSKGIHSQSGNHCNRKSTTHSNQYIQRPFVYSQLVELHMQFNIQHFLNIDET